jgi:flagellar motor switch protein FliN
MAKERTKQAAGKAHADKAVAAAPTDDSQVAAAEEALAEAAPADVIAEPAEAQAAPADALADASPVAAADPSAGDSPASLTIPDVDESGEGAAPLALAESAQALDMLGDVELDVKIELGRCQMLVGEVLRLGPGNVVELDKLAGDPVDVYVNDRHVARGEVLVVNENFCVRVNEILSVDR